MCRVLDASPSIVKFRPENSEQFDGGVVRNSAASDSSRPDTGIHEVLTRKSAHGHLDGGLRATLERPRVSLRFTTIRNR